LKTDSIFYRIFQTDPGILFELLGQTPELAQNHEFSSVEIKQVAFRIDGVLLPKPDSPDQTVWFIEVQFQEDQTFYNRLFGELYLYLRLHPDTEDYRAVVLFRDRNIEPDNQYLYRANLNSDQVHRIYLSDLNSVSTESLGIGLMQLILANTNDAIPKAQALLAKTRTQGQTDSKIAAIIELIETIVVYKFPQLNREDIERMLGLSELRETKVYQEAFQEGEQSLILRQLTRRLGTLPTNIEAQVQLLEQLKLEALGEALLDFSTSKDLEQWLQDN
jgi:predicted transposase/invertase (TIGR01784 family)